MDVFFLTEKERDLLQRLLDTSRRAKGAPVGSANIPSDAPSPEVYVAYPQEASGIPALTVLPGTGSGGYDQPGSATCDVFQLVDDGSTPDLQPVSGFSKTIYNLSTTAVPQDWFLAVRDKFGAWIASVSSGGGADLVECCLAENHPGRSIVFDVYVGVWDPGRNGWDYSGTGTGGIAKAIDHRYGMPSDPLEGAKGLFIPRTSTTFGTIYECVSLDCSAPPEGCSDTVGTGT